MEEIIKDKLKPLLEQVKNECYTNPENISDEEAMGLVVSKYFDWAGESIKEVAESAFEDANFSNAVVTIE